MESYSAWPLSPEYRELHLADNVLALSAGGISVPRFISAGPGTMPSLGTLLTGLPDTGLPMSYERAARNPFPTSPAMIFRRLGYRTRFFYGGYSFLLVDPYPEYWPEDWYSADDVYIDYDDGYYLYNRSYPYVRLAITVAL